MLPLSSPRLLHLLTAFVEPTEIGLFAHLAFVKSARVEREISPIVIVITIGVSKAIRCSKTCSSSFSICKLHHLLLHTLPSLDDRSQDWHTIWNDQLFATVRAGKPSKGDVKSTIALLKILFHALCVKRMLLTNANAWIFKKFFKANAA